MDELPRLALLHSARLYVLMDAADSEAEFVARVQQLITAGADMIQLRDKRLSDRELLRRARLLVTAARDRAMLTIINDRADIALVAGADGVHVGQDDLPLDDLRRLFSSELLIGVSTHSVDQARQAAERGADYIGVGPTFPSHTKSFAAYTGTQLLANVASATQLPAFAIGGINAERLPQVLATGIRRVAVSHAVVSAANPAEAITELRNILTRHDGA